jgi:hypothetical protein
MKTIFASVLAAAVLALAAPLSALPPSLVVGDPPTSHANGGSSFSAPETVIDLSHPANASGNLTQATFGWGAVCSSVVKIKVFHRTGSTLTMTGERGPFDSGDDDGHGNHTVALSPPLPIQQGDYIGMGIVANCGFFHYFSGFPSAGYVFYFGDLTGGIPTSDLDSPNSGLLALGATGTTTSYTAQVVPGVGSLQGAMGSDFKTSLQIIAPSLSTDVTGKLVFHPAGTAGSSADPSMALDVAAGHAASYDDVLASMGQSGIGSLDVVLDADSTVPVVYARVFNDAGADGTSGLGEPATDVTQPAYSPGSLVVAGGCTGFLSAPIDPSRLRLNIGARSLDSNSTIQFTLRNSSGGTRANGQMTLAPNEFLQVSASDLFGIAPGANDVLEVSVSGGAAIVYGATTDNTTNDPAAQFVTPLACVA